jgi:AcrR family transcriptional regulator
MRARGRATRQRLLDAGARVFADRGIHAARVDDIVKVAATSHGTFYLYFANKEELFRALAEQVAHELEALAGALPPLTPDPAGVAALDAWLRDFSELYGRTAPVIQAWTETETVATEMGRRGTVVWAAFTGALVDRIRATNPERLDPGMTALALVAMIERANYYVITGQVTAADGTLPATLARVAHGAVFGP